MYSIGIDIQDVASFREHSLTDNMSFYNRIFTGPEIDYCSSRPDPFPHFAARFCAKEAVVKAVGSDRIFITEIEITTGADGKPSVRFLKDGVMPENHSIDISLSHTEAFATAAAIVYPIEK
ncbi:MAG TPA: holo-ACP synthase [bacterium]|nr:holo-ACP synthase [bacterium]